MADIKGITVKIEGDASPLVKSLKEVENQIKNDNAALKSLDKALKLDPSNVDLLAAREKVLADKTAAMTSKMQILQQVQKDALSDLPEDAKLSASQMAELDSAIASTAKQLESLDNTKVSFGQGIKDAFESVKNSDFGQAVAAGADKASTAIHGVIKVADGVGTALKVSTKLGIDALQGLASVAGTVANAVASIGSGYASLAKDVVNQFADYEQALGGSEAVFGEFADSVQKAAQDSWKTMGSSTEQYLAAANKIGALYQGTGLSVQESAEMTTKAMTRAADMASVMGIDTQAALDAITGAAKGNYSMMDNLGVKMNNTTLEAYAMANGFGKAWKEMSEAEKAEVAMQYFFENTEKYAGNFEREATETISGSIGMLTSAWSNLITGLGNGNADIGQLAQSVVDSFMAVFDNVVPILHRLSENLPQVISSLFNGLKDEIPGLVEDLVILFNGTLQELVNILPTLVDAVIAILNSLVSVLNDYDMLGVISDVIQKIISAVVELLPQLIPIAVDLINTLVDAILDNISLIIDAAVQLATALLEGLLENSVLSKLVNAAFELINKLVDALLDPKMLKLIMKAAIDLIVALGQGFAKSAKKIIPQITEAVLTLIDVLTEPDNLDAMLEASLELAMAIVEGFAKSAPKLGQAVVKLVAEVISLLIRKGPEILQTVIEVIGGILGTVFNFVLGMLGMNFEDIIGSFDEVMTFIGNWLNGVFTAIGEFFTNIGEGLATFFTGIIDGITEFFTNIGEGITTFVTTAITSVVNFFTDIGTTIATKFEAIRSTIATFIQDRINDVTTFVANILGKITGLFTDIWNGLKQSAIDIGTKVKEIVDGIREKFEEIVTKAFTWGKDMIENIGKGIQSVAEDLYNGVKSVAGKIADFLGFSVPEDGPLAEWGVHNPGEDMMLLYQQGIEAGKDGLIESVKDVAGTIADFLGFSLPEEGPLSTFDEAGGDMIQVFIEGMMEQQDALINTLINIAQSILQILGGMNNSAFQAGVNIMQSFINGAQSMFGKLISMAKSAAQVVADYLHFSTPKDGPLKDFDKSGGDAITTFVKGMNSKISSLAKESEKAFNSVSTGAVKSAKDTAKEMEKVYNSISTGGVTSAKDLNKLYNSVSTGGVPSTVKNSPYQTSTGEAYKYTASGSGSGSGSRGGSGGSGSGASGLPKEIQLIVNLGQERFCQMVAQAINENTYVAGGY